MNVWNFIGRIVRDGELRTTPNGKMVLTFPVAVDSGYGDKKKTTWPRVQVWDKRAEALAPYIVKGAQIGVSGELTMTEYTNKEGVKAHSLDVRANDVTLIKRKDEAAKPAKEAAGVKDDYPQDDVPWQP